MSGIMANNKENLINLDYKMVTFSLGDRDYGINILSIKEIQKGNRFTYIPNAPDYVRGVYNLRGEIISVVDLRTFFGIAVKSKAEKPAEELICRNCPVEEKQCETCPVAFAQSELEKEKALNELAKNEKINNAGWRRKENAGNAQLENILIARIGETTLGIIVDSISKVINVDSGTIQQAHPLFADVNIQYIYGIVEKEEKLYIILDIDKIFGKYDSEKTAEGTPAAAVAPQTTAAVQRQQVISAPPVYEEIVPYQPPAAAEVIEEEVPTPLSKDELAELLEPLPNQDLPDEADKSRLLALNTEGIDPMAAAAQLNTEQLKEQLHNLSGIYINDVNENWFTERVAEYNHQLGAAALNMSSSEEAADFLNTFYSRCSESLWDDLLLNELISLLPDEAADVFDISSVNPNNKGNIFYIWNIGCAGGYESYSVAVAALQKNDKIKVVAQDKDLLKVASATSLTVPEPTDISPLYRPYLSEAGGSWQFSNELKNMIIFEYHDINHAHKPPGLNLVVVRDVLSFLEAEQQQKLLDEITRLAAKGVILIVGDNEVINSDSWQRLDSSLSAYQKI